MRVLPLLHTEGEPESDKGTAAEKDQIHCAVGGAKIIAGRMHRNILPFKTCNLNVKCLGGVPEQHPCLPPCKLFTIYWALAGCPLPRSNSVRVLPAAFLNASVRVFQTTFFFFNIDA